MVIKALSSSSLQILFLVEHSSLSLSRLCLVLCLSHITVSPQPLPSSQQPFTALPTLPATSSPLFCLALCFLSVTPSCHPFFYSHFVFARWTLFFSVWGLLETQVFAPPHPFAPVGHGEAGAGPEAGKGGAEDLPSRPSLPPAPGVSLHLFQPSLAW